MTRSIFRFKVEKDNEKLFDFKTNDVKEAKKKFKNIFEKFK